MDLILQPHVLLGLLLIVFGGYYGWICILKMQFLSIFNQFLKNDTYSLEILRKVLDDFNSGKYNLKMIRHTLRTGKLYGDI